MKVYHGPSADRIGENRLRLMLVIAGTCMLVLLCFAAALHDWSDFPASARRGFGGASINGAPINDRPPEIKPISDPGALRTVNKDEAVRINAALPLSHLPNPAATSFYLPIGDGRAFLSAINCMTSAIYYEAASESDDGQRAVGQVVLNRVRHPAFPNSVCGVVFQGSERRTGCQFSFTCDGSLARIPSVQGWARARRIASEVLAGHVFAPVGWATHYHTDWVAPYWAPTLTKISVIGAHIFYRWPDNWGRPGAFSQAYAGAEPDITRMPSTGQGDEAEGLNPDLASAPRAERAIIPLNGQPVPETVPLFSKARMPDTAIPASAGPASVGIANRWIIPSHSTPSAHPAPLSPIPPSAAPR
ncbi:cell wall hydrolase [Sphingobium aromaticiconvertens]|uniref:cell wall hydrolase n=1 Tax=Sphingobium aromaticiconvertens TaxID=365341 RepID=UPI00301803B7